MPRAKVLESGQVETVLVAEDNRELADLVRMLLEGLRYRTLVVHSGADALDLLRRLPPDERPHLLFSDVTMPGSLDGYLLAAEARRVLPGLAVLLTSGYDKQAESRSEAERGNYPVLAKPYRYADLAVWIRRTLDADWP